MITRRIITRSLARLRALTWMSVPAEIRLMILETIAYQKYTGWASLASVCREWQHVLEKVNFYKINLRVPCLDEFEYIISPQKRGLIHHICLNIELPRYTSRCCSKRCSRPAKIKSIVSDGIWKLFSILSTWGPENNLALEINAFSLSDCEHWFKNIYLSSDNVEHDDDALSDGIPYHDLRHGWRYGQQIKAPPRSAIQRLFRPIELEFPEILPRVKAVTCFIIRRQFRRRLQLSGWALLLNSFDRLEHISYEPWAPDDSWGREFHDRGTHPRLYRNYDYESSSLNTS